MLLVSVLISACCVDKWDIVLEEIEQDQDEEDIEDFVSFSIKSLEGFAMSNQLQIDMKDTTIETTDVGFTFAGGETEAANTKICTPHAEFPQGISVNVCVE